MTLVAAQPNEKSGAVMINEEWRQVSIHPKYQVSNLGRVRWKVRICRPVPDTDGYLRVTMHIDGKSRKYAISNLVAEAFIGPRPAGEVIRHRDGDSSNNRASNLIYGTYKENEADKEGHGTKARGATHGASKLTDAQVSEIRRRYKPRDPSNHLRALAMEFGVTAKTVHQIVLRKKWKHIP